MLADPAVFKRHVPKSPKGLIYLYPFTCTRTAPLKSERPLSSMSLGMAKPFTNEFYVTQW